ncbi:MAG: GntR family transcriptional regulator [Desulfosarcina sp.]|nr:GntR family transcriptional regulator [Desulfosarcina sp.]MBC2743568.1 GntR family transcriptional regulator [Desulfosarcina sp.]MBC2766477.1 GntR family transcriptional regulator [Desulfosarcina sp.]
MPIPEKTTQLNRSFMRDKVYHTLLEWITEGVLRPGEKLLDKELAETLGVSRTPVREALGRLEEKALVEASANRWTRVAEISMDEADLIYPIIWTLETLAASLALPHLAADDFKIMKQANADLAKAIKDGDAVKASEADAAFHDVYIRKTRNHHLGNILYDLKIKHRRLEVFYFGGCSCAEASFEEHRKIVAAFKAKNLEKAVELIRSNWETSLERLRSCTVSKEAPADEKVTSQA